MKRSESILGSVVRMASRKAFHGGVLLALAILAPGCPPSGGGAFPVPGSLQFLLSSFPVNEAGAPVVVTVTVTRAGGTLGAVSVNYATSNGTAGAADYTATNGTLTWAAGDGVDKTFTVTIANDAAVEGDETVNLALSLPTGGATLGTPSTAVITIADLQAPAAGVLQFSSAAYSVNENGGTATITVTRSGGTAGAASVNFADAGTGSATAGGTDYTFAGGTLTWAAAEGGSKTFTIAINNDALAEANETVNLGLNTFVGAVQGTTNTAVLTIIDNDSNGTIQLSSAAYSVTESGVTATITATRSGGNGGAVGITFATSDGTATIAGTDYAANTGTLSWGDGDSLDKTFTVSINNDTAIEGNETVNLTLSLPTGGAALGAQNTAVLTIQDDDCTIEFTAATFNIVEGIGTASITVSRTGSTLGAVSVDFSNPVGGTATSGGTDYTFTAGTLNWALGDGANKTINIPFAADALAEGNESINLALANVAGVGAAMGAQSTAVANVVDDDVTFVFSAATYSVSEASATVTITVNRVGASVGAASVDWTNPAGGTATGGGTDYTAAPATLNWATGVMTPQTFTVAITAEAAAEPDETFNVALANPTLAGGDTVIVGTPGSAVVTITNDDTNFQFSAASYSGVENAGAITVTVTRTGVTTGANSVTWGITDVDTVPADYTATPGVLNFAAGVLSQTFTVTPVNDSTVEGSEDMTLALSAPSPGTTLGTLNSVTLTIQDDDVPNATIDDVSVAEGAAGTVNLTFTITLSAPPVVAGSVTVNTANGTTNPATGGTDYVAIISQVVPFGVGVTTQTVNVTVNGDTTDEANETLFVNLSAPANLNITDAQGVGTITNDDDPDVTVADVALNEGTGGTTTFTFTVTLSRVSLEDVTFNYSTANGTATSGSGDYVAIPTTPKTITAGQLSTTIDVTVNADSTDEANETFLLDLFTFTNTNFVDPQATGTITNDDAPTITINNVTTAELSTGGNTPFSFTVTLSNPSFQAITVNYSTADGPVGPNGAVAGSDYTGVGAGTVLIPAGNTTAPIVINVNADILDEANETFLVNLTGTTYGTIGGANQGTGTITDDDGPNITITDVTLPEGNAGPTTFTFNVNLSVASPQDVSVTFATANGTATTANNDYMAGTNTVTINAGLLTQTINITVNGDTTGEANETFNVDLSGAVNGTITDNQGVGTITNDDPASITINDVSTTEGNAGTKFLTFTVSLSNTEAVPITVTYSTADGAVNPATAGSDYVAVAGGNVIIPAGNLTGTIDITINGDTTGEQNETFFVNLTGTTFGTITDSQGLGTITNDDGPNITITQSTTIVEGTGAGTTTYPFTVSVSFDPPVPVTVDYAAADGTATVADGDFSLAPNTLTFNPGGPLVQTVNVTIGRDNKYEGGIGTSELFTVNLSGASGGTITVPSATGTINDDDGQPAISINDVSAAEGNAGPTPFNFSVTLSNPSFQTITVNYSTADNTATLADSDYQQVNNVMLTFAPGSTTQPAAVNVNGDANSETNETFFVNLSGNTGATLSDSQGIGTIQTDDGPQVTMTQPPDLPSPGSTNVNIDTNLEVTFSMLMDKASVESRCSVSAPAGVQLKFFWDTTPPTPTGTVMTVVFDTVAPFSTITSNDVFGENVTVTFNIGAGAISSPPTSPMAAFSTSFTTRPDVTPPAMTTVVTNNGNDPRTVVCANNVTSVAITFTDASGIDTSGGSASINLDSNNDQRNVSVGGTANPPGSMTATWGSITATSATLTVTFNPALTSRMGYRFQISSIRDSSPNMNWLNGDVRFSIITANSAPADSTAPTVSGSVPRNGQTLVSPDSPIHVAFSELVGPDTPSKILITGNGATLYSMRYEPGDSDILSVDITPRKAWPASTPITVTVLGGVSGVKDTAGNNLAVNKVITFTTGPALTNAVDIDDPFSSVKDGRIDMETFNMQGNFALKDVTTNNRVKVDGQLLAPVDWSVTEVVSGLPVKGIFLSTSTDGGSELMVNRQGSGYSSLKNSMAYVLTLKNTIKGSMNQSFAQRTYSFTTASLAGNRAPTVQWIDLEIENFGQSAVATNRSVRTQTWVNDFDPGAPPNTTDVLPINMDDDGADTFNVDLTSQPFNVNQFEYQTPDPDGPGPLEPNETTLVSGGVAHTFTYNITDGLLNHGFTVKKRAYVWSTAELNQLTLNPPGAGAAPLYSWGGTVPTNAYALIVAVLDSNGEPINLWFVDRNAPNFQTPQDAQLPPGSYFWTVAFYGGAGGVSAVEDEMNLGICPPQPFTRP